MRARSNAIIMMRKQRVVQIVSLVAILAIGSVILWHAFRFFAGERGVANGVSDLFEVYRKAGSAVGSTFTNSLIQQFPFEGPIDWHLGYWADPFVSLSGRVNSNALHRYIAANASVQFIWSGVNTNGQDVSEEGWPNEKEHQATVWRSLFVRCVTTNAEMNRTSIRCDVFFPTNRVEIISQ